MAGEHAAAPAAPSHAAVVAGDGDAHAAAAAEAPPTAVSYPILFLFITLLIGCFTKLVLQHVKERHRIGIPYSVVLLVLGMVLGGLSWLEEQDKVHNSAQNPSMWTMSLTGWTDMSPRLILFIFLPALIFEGAAGTDYYIFQKQFPGGVMLAFPGMLVQIALIATFAVYALPYGWGWTESLLFGSILSATDPVAVIALMKELGLLSELRVLIEAESLLNDGSAIVVFELCHMILVHPASVQEYVSTGFQLVLGAPALGLGLFLASWFWLVRTLHCSAGTLREARGGDGVATRKTCTHARTHAHTHARTCERTHACMHACTHARTHTHIAHGGLPVAADKNRRPHPGYNGDSVYILPVLLRGRHTF